MPDRLDNPMHTAREQEQKPECDGQPFCDETGTETCGTCYQTFCDEHWQEHWEDCYVTMKEPKR